MMSTKTTRSSIAHVAVSTLLVAGGLVLAIVVAGVAGLERDLVGYATMSVGAMLGGFSASRITAGAYIEVVLGAAALIAVFYLALHFGSDAWSADALLAGCAKVGVASTLGSLVGALLGKQVRRKRSETAVALVWLSFLFTTGFLFLCIAASTVVGANLDKLGHGTILVSLILSAALGGATCQIVTSSRRIVLCGSGGLISVSVVIASVAFDGVDDLVVLLGGGAPLGLISLLFGAQGARLGWRCR